MDTYWTITELHGRCLSDPASNRAEHNPRGTMLCSTFIFIGSVVSAMGSNFESFNLVIGGRIILGLGSTVIESAGSKILAHWFQHRGLAFVYGLDIAWGK